MRFSSHHLYAASCALALSCLLLASSVLPAIAASNDAPAASSAATVMISEVKLGDSASGLKEFVNLFNASDTAIDLTGWSLQYAKPSFDRQYCTAVDWANHSSSGSASSTALSGNILARYTSQAISRSLNDNAGGSLQLVDAGHTIHDRIGWGSASSAAPCPSGSQAAIPPNGSSLKRFLDCDGSQPVDRDNDAQDFSVYTTPDPDILSGNQDASCQLDPTPQPTTAEEPKDQPTTTDPPDDSPETTTNPIEQPLPTASTDTGPAELPENDQPDDEPSTTPITGTTGCAAVLVDEVLPNPAGSDSGHEFIELHNPTGQAIALAGCSLKTSSNSKSYTFPSDSQLQADEYRAYSDTITGLTLANAAGGTVTWLDATNASLQTVTYPPNLDDDQAWALINDVWQTVEAPSPNTVNAADPEPVTDTGPTTDPASTASNDPTETSAATSLTPCKAGQERNPATNRCRTITTTDSSAASGSTEKASAACPAGQTRNPDTNRCKAISSSATANSTATACKAGQERNPETNRCKAVASASTDSAKPCQTGQVRNPATNRCKKLTDAAAAAAAGATVKDVKAASSGNGVKWLLIVLAILCAGGYAVYEWRQEIIRKLGLEAWLARVRQRVARYRLPFGLGRSKVKLGDQI